jgi:hypothetical protein
MEMSDATIAALPPELAKALVEAQKAVEAVKKQGKNKQLGNGYSYATADDIAAVSSAALNEHGAALLRLGSDLGPRRLDDFNLGNQAYAGDVIDEWWLIHEGGAALRFTTRGAVIVSKGRPHDKATAATQTYVSGVVGRGALAMEREDQKHPVDGREDAPSNEPIHRRKPVRSERKRDAVGPRCRGSSWLGDLGKENERLLSDIAGAEQISMGEAWDQMLTRIHLDHGPYVQADGRPPQSTADLSKEHGQEFKKAARAWLTELSGG